MWKAQIQLLGVLGAILLLMGASIGMPYASAHTGGDKANDNKGSNEDKGSNGDKANDNKGKGTDNDKEISAYKGIGTTRGFSTGRGTGEDTFFTIVSSQIVNDKFVVTVTGSGVVNGDFAGTYTFSGNITIDTRGNAVYQVVDVCQCTIMGKSGIVVVKEEGSGVTGGQFRADLTIIKATGGLSGLSGTGMLQGAQDEMTLLTSWTYVMHTQFK